METDFITLFLLLWNLIIIDLDKYIVFSIHCNRSVKSYFDHLSFQKQKSSQLLAEALLCLGSPLNSHG